MGQVMRGGRGVGFICVLIAAAGSPIGAPALGGETKSDQPITAPAAEAAALTALAAYERLTTYGQRGITTEYLADAERVFNEAMKAEPKDARWTLGQAMVARGRGERVKARDLAEQAAKLDPNSSLAQVWFGTACFESINEAGMFEKMGIADDGKAAYEASLKLDPNQTHARIGLFQFYLRAPGIAGGSMKKAREQAEALLKLPGSAAHTGHICLAQIAAEDEKWADVAAACDAAEKAATTPAEARQARTTHASLLLNAKEDPSAAIAVLEPLAAQITAKEDTSAFYMLGVAHQKLKQWQPARGYFAQVVEAQPGAINSRFALAECCEQLGELDAAVSHYEEFATRFPKDDRASKAQSAAKKLKKKLAKK